MTIGSGTRLGPYEVTGKLGEGGMGEVYRATDSRLKREVAIKVLPAAFTADRERLARFEREAQLLAQLHHPNIASIFGLEEQDGVRALVMELVEGETLEARLARGPLALDEALAVARQIAEALEAAHEKGIVHRDLKPANVKLTSDGNVKVLDFGLAKAMDAASSAGGAPADLARSPTLMHSPTLTAVHGTQLGVILGTAAYMAPEQARGGAVDKRADVWAWGVVLYEMLTGTRLFAGETVSDTLAAVLTREPDFARLPAGTPSRVREVIRRCLARDPKRRLRDIGDARLELEAGASEPAAAPPARWSRLARLAPWALVAGLAAVVVAGGMWRREGSATQPPLRRFPIDLPWESVPNWTDFDVALSPDGRHLAWYGRELNDVHVYVRALDSLDAVPLVDGRDAQAMTFSPDGEWLAVRDSRGVSKVAVRGGHAQLLASFDDPAGDGMGWGTDGSLLVGRPEGLVRVPSGGGPASPVTKVDAAAGETGHAWPFPLPDGRHALMAVERHAQSQLAIVDLRTGTYRALPLQGSVPAYSPAGYIVFRQGSSVLAAHFDLSSLAVVGEAAPVLENVHRGPYLAADGSMLYVPDRGASNARLVWVDRHGLATPIAGERLDYSHLALSPAGDQALLNIGDDVYVRDLGRGTRRLLSSRRAWFPIWTTDSRSATYRITEERTGTVVRQPADGSGDGERLLEGRQVVPTSWNARTGDLAYFDGASDIWIRSPDGHTHRLLASPANERSGRFSPDGRLLAYVSDETGTFQVYVTPYPGPGARLAVSATGGLEPIWSADSTQLYFRRGGEVWVAAITTQPTLAVGAPVELFTGPYTLDLMGHQRYDLAPDGRFLMVENSDDFRLVLVEGWSAELRRATAPREVR